MKNLPENSATKLNPIATIKRNPISNDGPFDKLLHAKDWALQNPVKATGLGLLGILSFRSKLARKVFFWGASTAGTMMFSKKLNKN